MGSKPTHQTSQVAFNAKGWPENMRHPRPVGMGLGGGTWVSAAHRNNPKGAVMPSSGPLR